MLRKTAGIIFNLKLLQTLYQSKDNAQHRNSELLEIMKLWNSQSGNLEIDVIYIIS